MFSQENLKNKNLSPWNKSGNYSKHNLKTSLWGKKSLIFLNWLEWNVRPAEKHYSYHKSNAAFLSLAAQLPSSTFIRGWFRSHLFFSILRLLKQHIDNISDKKLVLEVGRVTQRSVWNVAATDKWTKNIQSWKTRERGILLYSSLPAKSLFISGAEKLLWHFFSLQSNTCSHYWDSVVNHKKVWNNNKNDFWIFVFII